jgi:hypothetical protein
MKTIYKFFFVLILELKYIWCINLIVYTSLSFLESKNEIWQFAKTFKKNHQGMNIKLKQMKWKWWQEYILTPSSTRYILKYITNDEMYGFNCSQQFFNMISK